MNEKDMKKGAVSAASREPSMHSVCLVQYWSCKMVDLSSSFARCTVQMSM